MKILALTIYDSLGASSRIRTIQYIPALRNQNIEVSVSPLLSNYYLETLYANQKRKLGDVAKSYFQRLRVLVSCGKYDLIWIEKELFKSFPAFFERLLDFLNIPYVVVYDDAMFHYYDLSKNYFVRRFMGKKIDVVMRHAACVIAGNEYLAERASTAGAKRIEILPSVVDLNRYKITSQPKNKIFTVGWIGNPETTKYLYLIQDALTEVCRSGEVRMVGIGCGPLKLTGVPVSFRNWSEENEVADIGTFDVGVMPLPDDSWERGKCGYKLIQYMACGKPVIASPVGVNTKIVQQGVNGFLAGNKKEWVKAFDTLRKEPELAIKMGKNGRGLVENEYSVQATSARLARILTESAARFK